MHCVDRCVVRRYIETGSLPLFSMVDMDMLEHEFNDSFRLQIKQLKQLKFTKYRNISIEKKCLSEYDQTDCLVVHFYESLQTSYSFKDNHIVINLNFEIYIVKELQQSIVKLVLNILNCESIYFGSNVTTLLLALVRCLKSLFKFRWSQVYRYLIFLVGLTGFTLHLTSIFYGIVKDPLVKMGYFERLRKPYLPNQIFCFEFNESLIDPNVRLSGRYLDELTSEELNYETVFDQFWYFNGKNANFFYPNEASNFDSEISLTHWYYLNNKCFEIALKVRFSEQDLYTMPTKSFLGYSFNPKLLELLEKYQRKKKAYFMFRKPNTNQFSNSFFFDITPINETFYEYQIVFEYFRIVEEDKFESLKDPRKLFFETINIDDATPYIRNLVGNFRNDHRLTTRLLSLENHVDSRSKSSFELEVDDGLFMQYYSQVQNVSDHKYPACVDSQKSFYSIYTQYNTNTFNRTWFSFSISMASRETSISNEDNYTKLVQNFINSLALWLNISILECHKYVGKLFIVFSLLYKGLLRMRLRLENACSSLII